MRGAVVHRAELSIVRRRVEPRPLRELRRASGEGSRLAAVPREGRPVRGPLDVREAGVRHVQHPHGHLRSLGRDPGPLRRQPEPDVLDRLRLWHAVPHQELGRPVHRGRGTGRYGHELLRAVWGYSASVVSRTVDTHVAELRRKLERDAADPRHILTVWKVGYKFQP